jgi:hypothetical protein
MWVGVGAATNNSNGAIYSYDGITWVAGSGATFTSYDFLSSGGQAGIAWNGSLWVITTGTTTCTNPVFYSNNGINWTQSTTTSIFTGTISGTVLTVLSITSGTILIGQVISGSGVTSAVITSFGTGTGGTGTYIISVSQSVSTTITGTLTAGGTCAVWSGNRFVVGLKNATALSYITSPDGILWTSNAANQFTAPYGIAWSSYQPGSQITNVNVAIQQPTLAFGSGTNTIAYSYDGINWSGLGTTVFTTTGYCGCWNGKLWVAGGQSSGVGVLAYSYDGINWTIATQSILSVIVWSVAWNGTVFVAVGQGTSSTIAYSYDGINWRTPTVLPTGFTIGYCVAWGQNYFVVGGAGSTSNFAYSTDGINWTGGVIGIAGYTFRSIICGQSLWVIVGTSGTIPRGYWATNPTGTWTSGTGFAGGSVSQLYSISFGIYPVSSTVAGTTYSTIFCAGGVTASASSSGCVYSADGKTWTTSASGNTAFNNQQLNSLVWNGKRFIGIAGTSAASTRIAYSYNAQTWYSIPTTGITQPAQLFTSGGYGLATSDWPTLGSVYVDNALTLNSNTGLNTNNQLDIYSDTYFNNGYNNMALTVKSLQYPN